MNAQGIINKLVAAIQCAQAMDMPYPEGLEILIKNGWSYTGGQFLKSASGFVRKLQDEALSEAKTLTEEEK